MSGVSEPSALALSLRAEEEKLLHCVHCGFCLPSCPTYVRLGDEADSPRGRLHLMRAVVDGRLDPGSDAFQTHIDRCLGCRACEPVCPSGVEYGTLLERAREAARQARPPRLLDRLLLAVFTRPGRARPFGWFGCLLRGSGIAGLLARVLPAWPGLRTIRFGMAMLAASAPAPERPRSEEEATEVGAAAAPSRAPDTSDRIDRAPTGPIGILQGCVQDLLFRRVNEATARVLEVNGYGVVPVVGQGCCGALHAHAGDLEGARKLARRNLSAFEAAGIEGIAVNASGCGAIMREYGNLLRDDPEWAERAERLSSKVRDISELLVERGPVRGASLPIRVTYDAPCHLLHAQRVEGPPLQLLDSIPGLERIPLERADECCGGAGTYGIAHPDLGGRIGRDKAEAVLATGAEAFVTGNPGCLMQIGGTLHTLGRPTPGWHPVELLDRSYERAGLYQVPREGRRASGRAGLPGERAEDETVDRKDP